MALESIIFQQDPFNIYGCKDYNDYFIGIVENNIDDINGEVLLQGSNGYWEWSPLSSVTAQTNAVSSSAEIGGGGGGDVAVERRKRRRSRKCMKNKEEMEKQRMTHIAVERNRRKQMNDYLAVLRSLMPPSYAQRGDQASIVGGAINYVKELEQQLQFLEAHKPENEQKPNATLSNIFSNFFTFPQYSTCPTNSETAAVDAVEERRSTVADVEVTMAESHANIKISSKRRPKQLQKMVAGIQSICLTILHLNVTTVDQTVLYSFNVKFEDECQLTTVNEIASAVHDMMGMIQQESLST